MIVSDPLSLRRLLVVYRPCCVGVRAIAVAAMEPTRTIRLRRLLAVMPGKPPSLDAKSFVVNVETGAVAPTVEVAACRIYESAAAGGVASEVVFRVIHHGLVPLVWSCLQNGGCRAVESRDYCACDQHAPYGLLVDFLDAASLSAALYLCRPASFCLSVRVMPLCSTTYFRMFNILHGMKCVSEMLP